MNLLDHLGHEKLPSIINDPFKKVCIQSISVSVAGFEYGHISASGMVTFKNGNTHGQQTFTGPHFDAVVADIKVFINSLE